MGGVGLLTPQAVERLNASQAAYGEAPAIVDEPPAAVDDKKASKQRRKKKKDQTQYFAFSAFQLSPEPDKLPVPRLAQR